MRVSGSFQNSAMVSLCILLFQMASKNGRKSPQDDPSVIPDSQDVQEIRGKDIHSKFQALLTFISKSNVSNSDFVTETGSPVRCRTYYSVAVQLQQLSLNRISAFSIRIEHLLCTRPHGTFQRVITKSVFAFQSMNWFNNSTSSKGSSRNGTVRPQLRCHR